MIFLKMIPVYYILYNINFQGKTMSFVMRSITFGKRERLWELDLDTRNTRNSPLYVLFLMITLSPEDWLIFFSISYLLFLLVQMKCLFLSLTPTINKQRMKVMCMGIGEYRRCLLKIHSYPEEFLSHRILVFCNFVYLNHIKSEFIP